MLLNNTLRIYATSRAIREELKESLKSDKLLSKVMSIGEFEKKVVVVPNRVFIDEDTRVLLLKEASDFSTFKDLQIDREFFAFLKNSKFLFSFFDELAVEKVTIERLFEVDMYASYLEHLEILVTLQKRYISLLDKNNYCDKMILPYVYELNDSFISSFENIELYLEGYLNNFELELLKKISSKTKLIIDLHTNDNNQKMIDRFEDLGFALKKDMHYKLDLSEGIISFEEPKDSNTPIYNTFSSNSKILQSAFVKKSVHDFIKLGVRAEDIVVVLPDSNFANLLSVVDDENNFNFAMGKSFTQTLLFKHISALYEYSQDKSLENLFRVRRLGYEREVLDKRLEPWSKVLSADELMGEFEAFIKEVDDSEVVEIYKKELHLFSKLFPTFAHYKFTNILHLFLNRLKSCTIDDVSGGKVTVMEPLETRGVGFEGVIVVDFNDSFVPTRNQKDMFLSSDVRSLANLPISKDRENLQKYYYKRLFQRAKYVNISYVLDEQNSPTRFIDELNIKSDYHDKRVEDYHDILFNPTTQKEHFIEEDLSLEYDFTKVKLSSTSLKCYLDCKRKYYYKYIRKLEEAKIPKDESDERIIGIYIHDALKEFYSHRDSINSTDELYLFLQKELYLRSDKDAVLRFHIDMWLERLKAFTQREVKHFGDDFRVHGCEMELKTSHCGMNLVGKIDRVDVRDGKYYVIDYKSGKIPKTTKNALAYESDFQLQFYYLLVSTLGEVRDAYYYDLKNASLVEDALFDEKLLLLEERLNELKDKKQNFTMSEDINKCKYCPYIKLCDRSS